MEIDFILRDNFIRQVNVLFTKDGAKFEDSEDEHDKEIMRIQVHEDMEDMDVAPQYASEIRNLVVNYSPKTPTKYPIELKLVLTDESPIYSRPRRLCAPDQKIVQEQVAVWLKDGIVRESKSEFCSPVVVVKKTDGTNRLCVDYRRLNARTMKDHFPMPIIEDQLDKLQHAEVFSHWT